MPTNPEVLKRLEEIERDLAAGRQPPHHTTFLLNLTRALLESQGELLGYVEDYMPCSCRPDGRYATGTCPKCAALERAEKVRKGKV